jgi:hypothetical protein
MRLDSKYGMLALNLRRTFAPTARSGSTITSLWVGLVCMDLLSIREM